MTAVLAILRDITRRALLIGGAGLILLITFDTLAEWAQRHGLIHL